MIGCGAMGMGHVAAAAEHDRTRLVATVDRLPRVAAAAARRYGADLHFADYRQVLTRSEVEVVVIATWPSSHREIAIACLAAGKHVLLEKPLAPSLPEAEAVVRAVRRTGRKLRVGYILRHNSTYQRAAELISSGSIGFPIAMRMLGGEHVIYPDHWRECLKLITETSPIVDCGCHYVDVMRWCTGAEAVRVSGVSCRLDSRVPQDKYDYGIITIAFSDGSTGIYEVGWTHNYREFSEKEFIGPKGRLRMIYAADRTEHHEEGDLIEVYRFPGKYRQINVPGVFKPIAREMSDLLDCIEKDLDPRPALDDAMKSLQIVLAGERAIGTGKTTSIRPWTLA